MRTGRHRLGSCGRIVPGPRRRRRAPGEASGGRGEAQGHCRSDLDVRRLPFRLRGPARRQPAAPRPGGDARPGGGGRAHRALAGARRRLLRRRARVCPWWSGSAAGCWASIWPVTASRARRRAAPDPTLGGRVRYVQGRLEALPVADRGVRPGVVPGRPLLRRPCGAACGSWPGSPPRRLRPAAHLVRHAPAGARGAVGAVRGAGARRREHGRPGRRAAAPAPGWRSRSGLRVGSQWLQHRLEAPPAGAGARRRPAHAGPPDRVAGALRRGVGPGLVPAHPGLAPLAGLPGPRQARGRPVGAPPQRGHCGRRGRPVSPAPVVRRRRGRRRARSRRHPRPSTPAPPSAATSRTAEPAARSSAAASSGV